MRERQQNKCCRMEKFKGPSLIAGIITSELWNCCHELIAEGMGIMKAKTTGPTRPERLFRD